MNTSTQKPLLKLTSTSPKHRLRFSGSFHHCGGDIFHDLSVEHACNNIFRLQMIFLNSICNSIGCGHFHFLINICSQTIQSTLKKPGKT
jgi:hypothetical protein